MSETRTLDMLFLELSQFTNATTAKELRLEAQLADANEQLSRFRAKVNQQSLDHAKTEQERHEAVAQRDEAISYVEEVARRLEERVQQAEDGEPVTLGWRCGWCMKIVGTVADPDYAVDKGKAHSQTCAANPLVQQLSAITAARDEACRIGLDWLRCVNVEGNEEADEVLACEARLKTLRLVGHAAGKGG